MPDSPPQTRTRIVATPESTASPVTGFFEALSSVDPLTAPEERRSDSAPFDVEIVAESAGAMESASGLPITAHRSVDDVPDADVVIVPSMEFRDGG